jgi:hypothetical protein
MGGSVGGNRPRNNNFTIDGVDNNDVAVTGPLSPVIADSVAEFNLLTNQFSAEYGHSTAGQFNVITKSGTNELHGSAWYYGQNRNLNANDNLINAAIKAGDIPGSPRYDFNRTGGSAGAPIIKNKLFFFGAYEYQTRGRATTGVTVLAPTSAGLTTLNSLAANSAVRAVLAQLPTASSATRSETVNGQAIPVGPFQAFAPDFFTQHDFQTNVDATLGAHQLRGRFLYDRFRQPNVNADLPLPQFTGNQAVDNRKVVFTDVWTLSPRLVNDFRTSYSRNVFALTVPDAFSNFPNVAIDKLGLSFGPDGNAPQSGVQNVYQFLNNLSYLTGRHQLKGGVEFRHWIAPANFLPRSRGEFGYANLESLVNDLKPNGLNGALRGAGSGFFAGNQSAIYWFFQDDLKVTKNLTLNLGLRYEYTTNARDTNLQTLNAVSSVPNLFEFRKPETDKNNFAPRIGFAYAPSFEGGLMRKLFGESGKVVHSRRLRDRLRRDLPEPADAATTAATPDRAESQSLMRRRHTALLVRDRRRVPCRWRPAPGQRAAHDSSRCPFGDPGHHSRSTSAQNALLVLKHPARACQELVGGSPLPRHAWPQSAYSGARERDLRI